MQEPATLDLQRLIDDMGLVNDDIVIKPSEDHDDDDIRTVAQRMLETIKNTKVKMDEIDRDPSFFPPLVPVEPKKPPKQPPLMANVFPTHPKLIRWFFADRHMMKLVNNTSYVDDEGLLYQVFS
ncbi:hypothetical protein KI688_007906 [Linnemannia hyalina]|uniref:Uncharacterized protein n=1 Tax=Linnemannia hyalina TaxID=64524 RepID=A0A9P8BPE8_9FUNG|nr:hypothetical protein KI688_007906 [Linnemannia hyalina]